MTNHSCIDLKISIWAILPIYPDTVNQGFNGISLGVALLAIGTMRRQNIANPAGIVNNCSMRCQECKKTQTPLSRTGFADVHYRCRAGPWWGLVLGIWLMIAFHVGAQEPQADPEPVVLAIFDMEPGTNNPGLDVLFLDSLGIELGLHGLRLSDSGTPTILVRISYTVDETTIRYYLSAELVADGSILFSHSYREALSFQLDSILLGQAGQLARLLQQYVEENMTAIKVDMQGNDGKPAEDGAPAGQSGNGQAAERAVNANKPLVRQSTARVAGKDSSVGGPGLAIDAGIGFFLALGEPARYFKHGYIFETFVGYRFVTPASTILGFSFDVMYFIVDGYATDAQGLVASFGPALRLKPESAGRLIPGFKINLGAALFMISLAGDETRMKVIPCADTAMTMDLLLGRSAMKMSLGVKLMYENENILYGFTPGFGFAF